MPDTYVYDDTAWRGPLDEWHVYDNIAWRDLSDVWTYDNVAWRKVFEAVSCLTVTCDSGQNAWTESGCTDANECQYCIGVNTTNCTDVCHNIDGFLSTNGGSFLGQLSCRNKGCTAQTGTDCSAEMDCNLASGGSRCLANGNSYQGRLTVEDDSDGTDNCSYTGASRTGVCIA